MILRNRINGVKVKINRHDYYKEFAGGAWEDITPERTRKQVEASTKFVKLGKLHRTKANIQDVIRTFGPYHGIFLDALRGLDTLIKEVTS